MKFFLFQKIREKEAEILGHRKEIQTVLRKSFVDYVTVSGNEVKKSLILSLSNPNSFNPAQMRVIGD